MSWLADLHKLWLQRRVQYRLATLLGVALYGPLLFGFELPLIAPLLQQTSLFAVIVIPFSTGTMLGFELRPRQSLGLRSD